MAAGEDDTAVIFQTDWARGNAQEWDRIAKEQHLGPYAVQISTGPAAQSLQGISVLGAIGGITAGNGMANIIQIDSPSANLESPGDARLCRMVSAFDWNRAFDLSYFDEFFSRFP